MGVGGVVGVFFFNDTATTEIYTLSLHDALPISSPMHGAIVVLVVSLWLDNVTYKLDET